jgi:ribosomal protein L23
MTRRGRFAGRTAEWKKAIVRLKEGDKIEFFQNV